MSQGKFEFADIPFCSRLLIKSEQQIYKDLRNDKKWGYKKTYIGKHPSYIVKTYSVKNVLTASLEALEKQKALILLQLWVLEEFINHGIDFTDKLPKRVVQRRPRFPSARHAPQQVIQHPAQQQPEQKTGKVAEFWQSLEHIVNLFVTFCIVVLIASGLIWFGYLLGLHHFSFSFHFE